MARLATSEGQFKARGSKGPAQPARDAVPPRSAAQRHATEGGSRNAAQGGIPYPNVIGSEVVLSRTTAARGS